MRTSAAARGLRQFPTVSPRIARSRPKARLVYEEGTSGERESPRNFASNDLEPGRCSYSFALPAALARLSEQISKTLLRRPFDLAAMAGGGCPLPNLPALASRVGCAFRKGGKEFEKPPPGSSSPSPAASAGWRPRAERARPRGSAGSPRCALGQLPRERRDHDQGSERFTTHVALGHTGVSWCEHAYRSFGASGPGHGPSDFVIFLGEKLNVCPVSQAGLWRVGTQTLDLLTAKLHLVLL